VSPPDPPGIPGRNLPRGTQLPPRKDPRRDSPGPMPVLIPEQPAPRVDPAQPVRESVFATLTPDKRIANICYLVLTLFLGGGGAVAMNRGPGGDPNAIATLEAKVETLKGDVNQAKDLQRLAIKRQKALEAQVGAAFARGACVTRTKGAKEVQVCGSILLDGFPSAAATVASESIGDPPVFKAKIDGKTTPEWPEM
jgi:hypothetical protein